MELDALDRKAAEAFDGYIVRKDLVRKYARQYPVPTYVVEFLLGRYCATVDENEIAEGLAIVEQQLADRTVRTGDEELYKARAKENRSVRLIDLVRARLDAANDCYVAELPSLGLRTVRVSDALVREHQRLLTDGFYAEVTLSYDAVIAQQAAGRPFGIEALRPIQMSKADVLDSLARGRRAFELTEWRDFLLRSVGLEPGSLSEKAKRVALLRMVPFVERNYNLVELGPRGTGKSHVYQQISPSSHLISGGKATVAKMFVNNANGQRGLVCLYDVVCFDEVGGISFDQKDGVNIMKGYMASGEFSRGKQSIRAEGSLVFLGNLDADLEQQQRVGHLLSPLPTEMRTDTAFMDRLHAYVPGWDFPKLDPRTHLTDHFGLVSDFLSECWSRLRSGSRLTTLQGRVHFGGALSGRDLEAVNRTTSGLLKLLFPDPEMQVSDATLEEIVRLALESRRRVKEQQKRVLRNEFRNTHFSYILGVEGVEQFVGVPELRSEDTIEEDPLPPGQVWALAPGSQESGPGLYRIEVNTAPGGGARILNTPPPASFKESVKVGEQNLYTQSKRLVGDRNAREHEFIVQLRAFDADKSGGGLGVPVLVAMVGSLLERNTKGGLIIVGSLNLGGSIELLPNAVMIAEAAIDKRATTLLIPISARRALFELPDELATKISVEFYADAADAVFKSMVE
jgi:ATP-dependent Lon protease